MNGLERLARPALALVALTAAGCARCGDADDGAAVGYGAVEATEVRVAPLIGGTILSICCQEGVAVQAGDVLVAIDTTDLELQLQQAEAAVRVAAARERLIRGAARSEDLQSAAQAVRAAQVQLETAKREQARIDKLYQSGAVTPKQVDDARAGVDLATAKLEQGQAMLDKLQHGARSEEIQGVRAAREQAEAAVELLRTNIGRGEVKAPIAGRVLYRLAEPGEVARPGLPMLVLVDLARPYVDVYLPEPRIGEISVGGHASVVADAFPDRVYPARVAHVSDQAEFTPKNVQTAEQRSRLVFKVRLDVDNADLSLKPGMPARATFDGDSAATGPAR
ncbi:MAG: efflux RND transporter periplasmic adaptor subunit [Deltaproteobacteria bacterium]|nr:efflux RND transporter periplasmic adaptor subunit [Deltaproteobacteria bacterium]